MLFMALRFNKRAENPKQKICNQLHMLNKPKQKALNPQKKDLMLFVLVAHRGVEPRTP